MEVYVDTVTELLLPDDIDQGQDCIVFIGNLLDFESGPVSGHLDVDT